MFTHYQPPESRRMLVPTLLLLFLACTCVRAQNTTATEGGSTNEMKLLALSLQDSVRLRWAPASFRLWRDIQRVGLHVERNVIMRGNKVLPLAERQVVVRLTDQPLRPAEEATFGRFAANDRFVAIGGQAIYGERFLAGSGAATEAAYGAILNRAKEEDNRHGFGLYAADQSWLAAKMMGLAFTDRTARRDETYLYRLVPATPIPGYDPRRSGFTTVRLYENALPPPVAGLAAEFSDRKVILRWDLETGATFYSSYHILRSTDGVAFRTVNREGIPFVPLRETEDATLAYYQDSLPENNRPYFYKVVGNTPFGIAGPRSEAIQGMGLDAAPDAAPSLNSVFPTETGGFTISWTFPTTEPVSGFRVERATSDRGNYQPVSQLLPAGVRTFTDPSPLPTNYYRVTVYDQYNRPLSSYSALAQAEDEEPPAIPTGLRGIILKDGRVVLSWDENTEADLLGYRIYLSNQPEAEYSLATGAPIRENYYIDSTTLNTLSPKLFAKAVSLDYRHNTSDFSPYVELVRPDTLPPAPPLLTGVEADKNGVTVSWAFSRSLDLERHELQWRPVDGTPEDTPWETLETYNAGAVQVTSSFTTRDMPKGKKYAYRVVAYDLAGLSASSKTMVGSAIDDFIRKGVEQLRGSADRRAQSVRLSWSYSPERAGLRHFEVWRARGEERPLPIGQISLADAGDDRGGYAYEDRQQLRMNTAYRYHLKAVYADGGASTLSDPVTVKY